MCIIASSFSVMFAADPTILTVEGKSIAIKDIQRFLNAQGSFVATSGAGSFGQETSYFGEKTMKALLEFQSKITHRIATSTYFKLPLNTISPLTLLYIHTQLSSIEEASALEKTKTINIATFDGSPTTLATTSLNSNSSLPSTFIATATKNTLTNQKTSTISPAPYSYPVLPYSNIIATSSIIDPPEPPSVPPGSTLPPSSIKITLTASQNPIKSGATSTIFWDGREAASCSFSWDKNLKALLGSFVTDPLTANKYYVMSCLDTAGALATKNLSLKVIPISLTFTTSQTEIPAQGSVTLSWTTSEVESCISSWTSGYIPLSGTFKTEKLSKDKTYTISCRNINGVVIEKNIKIIIIPSTGTRLNGKSVGILVNDNDPASIEIARYYQLKRKIPDANIIHLRLPLINQLTAAEFAPIREKIYRELPKNVQVIAVAWTNPSRVNCNSITSAISRGYMNVVCTGSISASSSPYFNSYSLAPYTDFGIRPSMMLAGWTTADVKAMIDRGVASDKTNPSGSSYIMNTSDYVRSLRASFYPTNKLGFAISQKVNIKITNANSIASSTDALFYFQGLASVPDLNKNTYPLGAVGDHLTSFGGRLTDSTQMSSLEFTKNGFTGSYGTVSEPYAVTSKFPDPAVMIKHYTRGETLIEAYWKSVLDTAQGIFIGEPLANPWQKNNPLEQVTP